MSSVMSRVSRHALPLLLFVAVAVLLTWPLILAPGTRLGALHGPGDPYLNLWILGWDLRTISTSPWSLLNGAVFDANIFHPARQTLTYSDHFLLQALCVWPIYAATHNLVLCYNAVLFGSLVASAMAMYAFVRGVTASAAGAVVAGIVWGFWPFHFAHLGHLQLQALYFLPLAFLFLHRVMAGARTRDAVGLGLMTGLQAVASVYWGLIGGIAILVAALALVVTAGGRRVGRLIRLGLLAAVVALAVVLPVLWPYVQAQQREGFGRNLYEAAQHAATAGAYLSAPRVNWLYGSTSAFTTDRGAESELFVGLTVIALAILGLAVARRRGAWPLAAGAIAVVIVGVVLSLGPDGVRPLYAFLQRWVFGFQAIRAPARFAVLVAFGLAVLAAIGTRELARLAGPRLAHDRARGGVIVTALLTMLLVVEYANRPITWSDTPPLSTPVGGWLSQARAPGAVLYLPLTIDIDNTPFMVESLQHGRPIVNGYSGLRPPFYAALVDTFHTFPSADGMWTLKDLDVRYVVSPSPIDAGTWPVVERAHFDAAGGAPTRFIYEVVWTPAAEARLGEPAVPAPPPPGAIPFQPGEAMTYRVEWAGPAGTVTAGEVDVTVAAPDAAVTAGTPGGAPSGASAGAPASSRVAAVGESPGAAPGTPREPAAYRFTVAARTAPWIARFFEADDRFITDATAGLMPVRHERRLREGRRAVDEAVRFDYDRRLVTPEAGGSRPPLRLWPGARDPIAAFFYLRTLPLAPGSSLQIPVNDNGRNLILDIQSLGVERITVGGHEQEALRVTPVLRQRIERRQPLAITVWLSHDARRIPLAADIHAGFGTLRLELERYAPR
jgi:hypothetical protein